ncbi:hypothetical protein C8R43DRAFT_960914 [Mycena crocata]|nr:hypothetical protein C8R43DRAFT_960914 [Mycena crocata]
MLGKKKGLRSPETITGHEKIRTVDGPEPAQTAATEWARSPCYGECLRPVHPIREGVHAIKMETGTFLGGYNLRRAYQPLDPAGLPLCTHVGPLIIPKVSHSEKRESEGIVLRYKLGLAAQKIEKKNGLPSRVAVVGLENIETVHEPKPIQAAGALCMDRVAVLWSDPTAHRPREVKGPMPSSHKGLIPKRARHTAVTRHYRLTDIPIGPQEPAGEAQNSNSVPSLGHTASSIKQKPSPHSFVALGHRLRRYIALLSLRGHQPRMTASGFVSPVLYGEQARALLLANVSSVKLSHPKWPDSRGANFSIRDIQPYAVLHSLP